MEHPMSDRDVMDAVRRVTLDFSPIQKAVMVYWLFADKKMTLEEIGEALGTGLSKVRIGQHRDIAIRRIERELHSMFRMRRPEEPGDGPVLNERLEALVDSWKEQFKPEDGSCPKS